MVTGVEDGWQEKVRRLNLAPSIAYVPNDVRTSLRYHGSRDNAYGEPSREAKSENRITEDDVETIMADIAMRFKALTLSQLQTIRGKLEASVGASRDNLGDLQQQAAASAAGYIGENAPQQLQTPEQKLWAEFGACEKEIQDAFEKLYREGKISREQMDRLRSERARLDALPETSDERIAGEAKFAAYQKDLGVQVREEAHQQGDAATAASADKLVNDANAQEQRLKELWSKRREMAAQQQTGQRATTTNLTDKNLRFDDDNPPAASPDANDVSKMAVVNVTPDDVRAPPGGKDRATGRTLAITST